MKILYIPIKKKWFDMIAEGIKKEEYREQSDFWFKRLTKFFEGGSEYDFKSYDVIEFRNGYGKNVPTMIVEFNGVEVGTAVPEWSDNWKGNVFKIKLGKITSRVEIALKTLNP